MTDPRPLPAPAIAANRPEPKHNTPHGTAPHPWRELTVPLAAGDHASISALRHLAQSALTAWGIGQDQAGEVIVVLSELATNALLHTGGPARIRLHARTDRLVLDVADTSPVLPDFGTGPRADTDQPHGFGLALITTALADSVTVTRHPERGKTVTATFTLG